MGKLTRLHQQHTSCPRTSKGGKATEKLKILSRCILRSQVPAHAVEASESLANDRPSTKCAMATSFQNT